MFFTGTEKKPSSSVLRFIPDRSASPVPRDDRTASVIVNVRKRSCRNPSILPTDSTKEAENADDPQQIIDDSMFSRGAEKIFVQYYFGVRSETKSPEVSVRPTHSAGTPSCARPVSSVILRATLRYGVETYYVTSRTRKNITFSKKKKKNDDSDTKQIRFPFKISHSIITNHAASLSTCFVVERRVYDL